MLLHAKHRWPTAVEAYLWPYALRPANKVHNVTPDILRSDFKSPLQLFTNTTVTADLGHFRPFGCPVYVLDNSMQQGTKIGKWEARSRMGLYLGMSTVHARSVALILNLTTCHVCPQFHLKNMRVTLRINAPPLLAKPEGEQRARTSRKPEKKK